jgi:hypothetical protein
MFFVSLILLSLEGTAQDKKRANNDTETYRYELEGVKQGVEGTQMVKVWSYSRKPEIAIDQAKKNAVHGVLFKGFNVPSKQSALITDPGTEFQHKAYFAEFFRDGGRYLKFVEITGDGTVNANDKYMVTNKEWKIGVVVSVRKDALRKELESAGVLKSLGHGF